MLSNTAFLVGFMGSGKSSILDILKLNPEINTIDLDEIVLQESEHHVENIQDLFNKYGEEYFRNLEKKTSLLEIKKTESVISLGGGAFMNKEIRSMVLNTCCSFWLDLKIKTIEDRIKNTNKRPLLNKKNLRFSLNEIYNNRKDIYNLANHKIDCNKITLVDVVDKIINLYANKRN